MTPVTLNQAVLEAQEFIRRAEVLRAVNSKGLPFYYYPKESGSLRRQSMELTRALAEMRRPVA